MQRDYLFYAANFDPEINRLFKSFIGGDLQKIETFKRITLQTLDNLLSYNNLSQAGREEWSMVRSLVSEFESLSLEEKTILCKYGAPFSYLFAKHNNL